VPRSVFAARFSLPSSVFYHSHKEAQKAQIIFAPFVFLCDGPVAQLESERDRAKVEVTRSNRVRSSSFMWAVAQLEEHCTVTAVVAGSSPVSPPKRFAGTVAER
jgi:hypothetical protein